MKLENIILQTLKTTAFLMVVAAGFMLMLLIKEKIKTIEYSYKFYSVNQIENVEFLYYDEDPLEEHITAKVTLKNKGIIGVINTIGKKDEYDIFEVSKIDKKTCVIDNCHVSNSDYNLIYLRNQERELKNKFKSVFNTAQEMIDNYDSLKMFVSLIDNDPELEYINIHDKNIEVFIDNEFRNENNLHKKVYYKHLGYLVN